MAVDLLEKDAIGAQGAAVDPDHVIVEFESRRLCGRAYDLDVGEVIDLERRRRDPIPANEIGESEYRVSQLIRGSDKAERNQEKIIAAPLSKHRRCGHNPCRVVVLI